jgi:hypothetical protein
MPGLFSPEAENQGKRNGGRWIWITGVRAALLYNEKRDIY